MSLDHDTDSHPYSIHSSVNVHTYQMSVGWPPHNDNDKAAHGIKRVEVYRAFANEPSRSILSLQRLPMRNKKCDTTWGRGLTFIQWIGCGNMIQYAQGRHYL